MQSERVENPLLKLLILLETFMGLQDEVPIPTSVLGLLVAFMGLTTEDLKYLAQSQLLPGSDLNPAWEAMFDKHFPHHEKPHDPTGKANWQTHFEAAEKIDYRFLDARQKTLMRLVKDHDLARIQQGRYSADDFADQYFGNYILGDAERDMFAWSSQAINDYLYGLTKRRDRRHDFFELQYYPSRKYLPNLYAAVYCGQDPLPDLELPAGWPAGWSPEVDLILRRGKASHIRFILRHPQRYPGQISDIGQRTPLHFAASRGDLEAVKAIAEEMKEIDIQARDIFGMTAFHYAKEGKHTEVIRYLRKIGVQEDYQKPQDEESGLPFLHSAAGRVSDLHATRYLLSLQPPNQVDVERENPSEGSTALYWAAQWSSRVTEALHQAGANFKAVMKRDGNTALHTCSDRGEPASLRYLLTTEAATLINQENKSGRTPLQMLAYGRNARLIPILLAEDKLDPMKGDSSQTPLDVLLLDTRTSMEMAYKFADTCRSIQCLLEDKRVQCDGKMLCDMVKSKMPYGAYILKRALETNQVAPLLKQPEVRTGLRDALSAATPGVLDVLLTQRGLLIDPTWVPTWEKVPEEKYCGRLLKLHYLMRAREYLQKGEYQVNFYFFPGASPEQKMKAVNALIQFLSKPGDDLEGFSQLKEHHPCLKDDKQLSSLFNELVNRYELSIPLLRAKAKAQADSNGKIYEKCLEGILAINEAQQSAGGTRHEDTLRKLLHQLFSWRTGWLQGDDGLDMIDRIRIQAQADRNLLDKLYACATKEYAEHPDFLIHFAVCTNQPLEDIEELMLGANANFQQNPYLENRTPLMMAARYGYLPIIELFLNANVDVRHADNEGRTAIHYAAMGGHLQSVVRLLREANVDVFAKDRYGKMAVEYVPAKDEKTSGYLRKMMEELKPVDARPSACAESVNQSMSRK